MRFCTAHIEKHKGHYFFYKLVNASALRTVGILEDAQRKEKYIIKIYVFTNSLQGDKRAKYQLAQ